MVLLDTKPKFSLRKNTRAMKLWVIGFVNYYIIQERRKKLMTQNQIAYNNYLETQRHQKETERETNRSNLAREAETSRHNVINEAETERHNRATEGLTRDQLKLNQQQIVNNYIMAQMQLTELRRHQMATESEVARSNRERERLTDQQLLDQRRNMQLSQNYAGQQLRLNAQGNRVAQYNAETARINANTSQFEATTHLINANTALRNVQAQEFANTTQRMRVSIQNMNDVTMLPYRVKEAQSGIALTEANTALANVQRNVAYINATANLVNASARVIGSLNYQKGGLNGKKSKQQTTSQQTWQKRFWEEVDRQLQE